MTHPSYRDALLVVPVLEDLLEQHHVAPGHRLEEVAGDGLGKGLVIDMRDRAVATCRVGRDTVAGRERCPYRSRTMASTKSRGARVAAILAALFVLLVVLPAAISLASGKGAVCLDNSACPLSAVNPCVRKPSFAVVGRCEVAIH